MVSKIRIPNLELLWMQDPAEFTGDLIVQLSRKVAYIPGPTSIDIPKMHVPQIAVRRIEVPQITVPATWWDHFKLYHFDVLLRWFPVRWTTLQERTVLQEGEILQKEHEVGGHFEARDYLPDVVIPDRGRHEYRWYSLSDLSNIV